MPHQHRARQIVKMVMAPFAAVFPPRRLGGIPTWSDPFGRITVRARIPSGQRNRRTVS